MVCQSREKVFKKKLLLRNPIHHWRLCLGLVREEWYVTNFSVSGSTHDKNVTREWDGDTSLGLKQFSWKLILLILFCIKLLENELLSQNDRTEPREAYWVKSWRCSRKTLKFSIVSPSPTPDGGLRFSFDIITLPCLGSISLQEVFLVKSNLSEVT